MYENHHDDFGRRAYRSEEDRPRGSGRYWQGQSGAGDRYRREAADDDRTDWRGETRYRSQGDYSPYREDNRRERFGRDGLPHHHDHDDRRYGYGYDRWDDNRQQPYFTGQQNSWAIPPVSTGSYGGSYAGRGYGRDYREHGYGSSSERGFFEKAGDEVASWFGDEDAARRREADHRGRGPKDYVRSDERIRDDVNDRLTEDRRVDASNITVMVEKGEVTLNGTVAARQAKRRAEDIVEDISGVKHVQNNLRVAETAAGTGAYDSNWALNPRSTAEGGTLGKDATPAKH